MKSWCIVFEGNYFLGESFNIKYVYETFNPKRSDIQEMSV